MRVGVITTSYPRWEGDAAGHFVATLNQWLNQQGVDVEVICASEDEPLFYRGGAPTALAGGSVRDWWRAVAFTTRLSRAVEHRSKQWDAVVSHWLLPSAMVADAVADASSLPHVAIAHGSDVALVRRLPFAARWLRGLARRADLVYVAQSLVVDGAPGRVVPMGIAIEDVVGGDRTAYLPIDTRGTVALILSRLIPDKGVDRVLSRMPLGVTLVIAGDGPERRRLEQLASRGQYPVEIIGVVEGETKRNLLARADVLLVPSRRDGAPTVIAEAAAVGLPVVATRTGGIPELPMRGLFLYDEDARSDGDDFASALTRALAHGRLPPPSPDAWPNQAAQAEQIFRPLLRRFAPNPALKDTERTSNCCQTVTVRL